MRPWVVFDLETVPSTKGLALEPSEEHLNRGIRSSFKKATVEEYRKKNAAEWADRIREKASIDWRLGQVIAGGTAERREGVEAPVVNVWILGTAPQVAGVFTWGADTEEELVEQLWGQMDDEMADVVGFGARRFDLPWLIGRSAAAGIAPTRRFNLARYRTDAGVVDWEDVLSFHGSFETTGWSLAQYAQFFELAHRPIGDGSQVPEKWAAGDADWVVRHLASDLLTLLALHERFAAHFLED